MFNHSIDLAIVTGAGRGIGRAAALAIGEMGVPILCVSRTETCAAVASNIVARGGKASALALDLADYVATKKQVSEYIAARSAKHIVVVAAAGILGPPGPVWESDLAGWDKVFRVNVLGNVAVLQAALPQMRASGFGRVAMFAGGGGAYAYPTFPAYAISKTALVREVENIGVEMKDMADFSAVILAPGAVDTDTLADIRAAGAEIRTPTSITEPVGFLTSFLTAAEARKLSGRFIHVRDVWREVLADADKMLADDHWKLRRVE
jgi:NAD(P)-dependent dehydrogenase (short-subunit alcohol dehydrogenase family)